MSTLRQLDRIDSTDSIQAWQIKARCDEAPLFMSCCGRACILFRFRALALDFFLVCCCCFVYSFGAPYRLVSSRLLSHFHIYLLPHPCRPPRFDEPPPRYCPPWDSQSANVPQPAHHPCHPQQYSCCCPIGRLPDSSGVDLCKNKRSVQSTGTFTPPPWHQCPWRGRWS